MTLGRVVIIALMAWIVPPTVMSMGLALSPNVLLAQTDAGSVIGVSTERSWFRPGDTTTLHTTMGALSVEGIHSAPLGQRLVVRESTKDGEQVCVEDSLDSCATFLGNYMGVLRVVPHGRVVLTWAVRQNLWAATGAWTLVAGVVSAVLALFWWIERAGGCGECDAGESST